MCLELALKDAAAFVVRTRLAAPPTGEESELWRGLTFPETFLLTIERLRFALGDDVNGVVPGVRRSI